MAENKDAEPFGFIGIEGKRYPKVIMGEDKFLGLFGKDPFDSEERRGAAYRGTIEAAYDHGVRGFSVSPHETLIGVLKGFKKAHPDVVCIANPHWELNYNIGGKAVWGEYLDRFSGSITKRRPELASHEWFQGKKEAFSDKELADLRLDREDLVERLDRFRFCDFSLVGNLGRSALILLGREDIIIQEIEVVRDKGMVPVGMCEATLAIPKMEKLDVAATWTWINKDFACPDIKTATGIIKKAAKPVTAYRILSSPKGFDLDASIRFIKNLKNIRSIVVGVRNPAEAEETFSKIKEILG